MAEMGLTPTDRWHLLGKHACHHAESTDFVEVMEFDEPALTDPEWGTLGVPADHGGPDTKWCRHCKDTIDDLQYRRYNIIADLKGLVPYRNVSWTTVDCDGDCSWCGKSNSATQYNDKLDATVCPTCAWKYNRSRPDVENPPETDRRLETPTDEVDPIRYTTDTGDVECPQDEQSASESIEKAHQRATDEQRPYIEVKIKGKYADVVCDIAGTGHRFRPAAIEEIESLQAEQKTKAEADPDHKSSVMTDISPRRTHVRMTTLFPEDARRFADDLAAIAADPENWQ
ncbi:hypothetical protein [Halovenus salina]|uniref:Uncharacterized protein n=1 Tax=Halovenus salina TaxID=1510225 RepID=A0ABD5W6R9_9EURY|nr:hypothetical protein [Halovenus salina]